MGGWLGGFNSDRKLLNNNKVFIYKSFSDKICQHFFKIPPKKKIPDAPLPEVYTYNQRLFIRPALPPPKNV